MSACMRKTQQRNLGYSARVSPGLCISTDCPQHIHLPPSKALLAALQTT